MANPYVREWQRHIRAVPDGLFGPKTLAASFAVSKAEKDPETVYSEIPWSLPSHDAFGLEWRSVIDPALARFVDELAAKSRFAFGVYESLRTRERQAEYVRIGKSWTMNSRHLTGHAVDLVWIRDGKAGMWDWSNAEQYEYLAHLGMEVSGSYGFDIRNLGLAIGRDWFHFEVTR